eukprot:gene5158-8764_t
MPPKKKFKEEEANEDIPNPNKKPKSLILTEKYVHKLSPDYDEYNSALQWKSLIALELEKTIDVSGKVEGLYGIYKTHVIIKGKDKCTFKCSCPHKPEKLKELKHKCCKHCAALCVLYFNEITEFTKIDGIVLKNDLLLQDKNTLTKVLSDFLSSQTKSKEKLYEIIQLNKKNTKTQNATPLQATQLKPKESTIPPKETQMPPPEIVKTETKDIEKIILEEPKKPEQISSSVKKETEEKEKLQHQTPEIQTEPKYCSKC